MYLGPVLLLPVGAGAFGTGAEGMGAVPLLGPLGVSPSGQRWQVPFTQTVLLPPAAIESPVVLSPDGEAVGAAVVPASLESGVSGLGASALGASELGVSESSAGSGAPAFAQSAAPEPSAAV